MRPSRRSGPSRAQPKAGSPGIPIPLYRSDGRNVFDPANAQQMRPDCVEAVHAGVASSPSEPEDAPEQWTKLDFRLPGAICNDVPCWAGRFGEEGPDALVALDGTQAVSLMAWLYGRQVCRSLADRVTTRPDGLRRGDGAGRVLPWRTSLVTTDCRREHPRSWGAGVIGPGCGPTGSGWAGAEVGVAGEAGCRAAAWGDDGNQGLCRNRHKSESRTYGCLTKPDWLPGPQWGTTGPWHQMWALLPETTGLARSRSWYRPPLPSLDC